MEASNRLALIRRVLVRQPVEAVHAETLELGKMVAERARLRRASARTRNGIPALRRGLPGHAGARIDVDDGAAGKFRQIDRRAVSGDERHRWQPQAREVTRGA